MRARRRQIALCLLLPLLACGRIEPVDHDASDDSSTDPARDEAEDGTSDGTPDPADDPVIDFGTDCPPVRIQFEAEDMTLVEFSTDTSPRSGIGDYIFAERNTASATIDIGIPCSDEYVLWGLVSWEDNSSDSVFWEWDSSGTPMVWDFMQCAGRMGWHWDQVTGRDGSTYCVRPAEDPEIFRLREGDHTFEITPRELFSNMAEFVLTNDLGFTPTPP